MMLGPLVFSLAVMAFDAAIVVVRLAVSMRRNSQLKP